MCVCNGYLMNFLGVFKFMGGGGSERRVDVGNRREK